MLRSFALLFASVALATAYNCNGTFTINAPSDLSQPTYFPSGWNGNQPIPELTKSPEQSCSITVNIPKGVYATVTYYRNFGTTAGTYMLYSNKKYKLIDDNDENPYIYCQPYFIVNLGSASWQNTTNFGFKIVWSKFPEMEKNVVDIYKGKPPVAFSPNNQLTTFVGEVNSLLSIMAFSLKDPSQDYLLRQSAVFSGVDLTGDFVGTLDQVLRSHNSFTTYTNKRMTVYTFGLNQIIDYPIFMIQDWEQTSNVNAYSGFNCPSTGNCNVTLFGNYGRSYTVSDFNGSEYVKDFTSFPDTASISVYENSISNTSCIATLTSSDYKSQLPLEVKGTMKFYVLNGYANVDMVVSRDTSRASRLL